MTETTVNVQPSAERDLGRLEGKTDIVVATVSRMEQDQKVGTQLVNERFQRVEGRITTVEKNAAEDRQRIKDKVSQLGFRMVLLASAVVGTQVPLKGILAIVLKAF